MKTARYIRTAAIAALASVSILGITGCSVDGNSTKQAKPAEGHTLSVFATTGYLGDAVKNVAPDADVTVMVGPGGDPHTYQPTTQDMQKLLNADAVIWNGLHLEAQMLDTLKAQGDKQVAAAEVIPQSQLLEWPEEGENGEKLHDPHVWNSPDNWKLVVDAIVAKLSAIDPDKSADYKKNGAEYQEKIDQVKSYVAEKFDSIPEKNRILVTGHDAFNYLGRDFGMSIKATDTVTSEAEINASELNDLAEFIAKNKVKAIFQDNLKNPQAVQSLKENIASKGHTVQISDAVLYADSLGEAAPNDTYLGVMKHNADTISGALK